MADAEKRGYIGRMSRYVLLRDAIVNLAAPADAQVAYLDESFIPLTGGGSAAGYGNNELALEFDDIFSAVEHMRECGEISGAEVAYIRPLGQMLNHFYEQGDEVFWKRDALFVDSRWEELRRCAATIIPNLPNEQRESDYARSLRDGNSAVDS